MGWLKKVPVNSDCPGNLPSKTHGWTTSEGKDAKTGDRKVVTWCKYCSAVPK
jgi:hypothetical protein